MADRGGLVESSSEARHSCQKGIRNTAKSFGRVPNMWLMADRGGISRKEWAMGYYGAAINPLERWVGGFRNRGKDIVMELVQYLLDQ